MVEEKKLIIKTITHTNVVLRVDGAKTELNYGKHVLFRKRRDLLWLKRGGALQFNEAFTMQFDQVPSRRWRVLKVVVHSVDHTEVRLDRFCTDCVCFEKVTQVGDDRL